MILFSTRPYPFDEINSRYCPLSVKHVIYGQKFARHMDNQTLINGSENKIHIDASVKIGNYDMKFKATGYRSQEKSLFSVIIYDRLYELKGNPTDGEAYQWQFITENLLPEDLASVIGKEIEKQAFKTAELSA